MVFHLRMRWRAAIAMLASAVHALEDVDAGIAVLDEPIDVDGMYVRVRAPDFHGTYPLVVFMSGFTGSVPVDMYSDLLNRIVKKGYVVAALDHTLSYPNYAALSHKYGLVLNWAGNGGLQTELGKAGFKAKADAANRLVAAGQSSGNHIVAGALSQHCNNVKAAVFIDPVDGADPYHFDSSQDLIHDGTMVNFTVPTLFTDNGLDQKHIPFSVPCMPASLGTEHWMKAWASPFWRVNATAYSHIDCLNSQTLGKLVCPTDPSTDKTLYRQMLADTTHNFLSRLFAGNQTALKELEDPGKFSVAVELNHDLHGLSYEQVVPGCKNLGEDVNVLLV